MDIQTEGRESLQYRLQKHTDWKIPRGVHMEIILESGTLSGILLDKNKCGDIMLSSEGRFIFVRNREIVSWSVDVEVVHKALDSIEGSIDIKKEDIELDPLYKKIRSRYKIKTGCDFGSCDLSIYRKGFLFWNTVFISSSNSRVEAEQKLDELVMKEYIMKANKR